MLYRNFVVRAMNPERWSKPAIGQGAIRRRLESVKKELNVLTEQTVICSNIKTGLDAAGTLVTLSDTEIEHVIVSTKDIASIPNLEEDLASLQKNRDAIDITVIESLKSRISVLDNDITSMDDLLRKDNSDKGRLEEKQRRLQTESLPSLKTELHELESSISLRYNTEWIETTGFLRYSRELSAI